MLGGLTVDALPLYSRIALGASVFTLAVAAIVIGLITWYGKWRYLWKNWLVSLDHKKIGIMYIVLALVMLMRGFIDAIMMRLQQTVALHSDGFLPPSHFDQVFTSHGVIMIFFMAMPFLTGLINIVVPQQIGARDVAFPFMNSVSLWLTVAAAGLVMTSLIIGKFSTAGWSGYPPYSEAEFSPGVGVTYWIWIVFISGIGSTLTGINFVVTILRRRAPGMTLMRMPLFTWTALCTSALMIFAFPALTVASVLLGLDRYLHMHFFTNDGGGNMMNYANLFWIWGHPEVYILILPAFGVYSEVVATFSAKALFNYKSMVYATAGITLLSFMVWLHHFFTMGASADVNAFFGIATMIIAVPTGVKLFDWLLTMYRGRVSMTSAMYWTLGFIVTFTIGGVSGVLLAIAPIDFAVHNTTFLVAHFHNMLIPGALFGYLVGYQYWFPKSFGFTLDERWGKRAFWAWMAGFYLAFMPLYWLGLMGMPRRVAQYDYAPWQPYLMVALAGALFIGAGIACLALQLVVSVRNRAQLRDTTGDPWNGRTLEWSISSPPPAYNFAIIPQVVGKDAWTMQKTQTRASGATWQYSDIVMRRDSACGFIVGVLGFWFAFAMVWGIWWFASMAAAALLAALVMRSLDDDESYVIPAHRVAQLDARHRALSLRLP